MTDPVEFGDLPTNHAREPRPRPSPPTPSPDTPDSLDWLKPVDEQEPEACPETVIHAASDRDELATTEFAASRQASEELGQQATQRAAVGPAGSPGAGQRIGRFRVQRELGAGAFGKVYLAQDPQLDRDVAIKVAKVGLWPSDEDRQRFLREARAAAQLRHPHIVPVYEFGEVGEADYIAYQYVPGTTLRHILSRHKKMTVSQAVDLTAKIANALHYAHTKNIIHRDVKPENILVDEEGQPHVADFGCARREDSGGLLTVEGQVMGTPAYMSPEQAAGQARLADGRSDVWSVGVMLEEMLTGRRPFRGTLTELLISIREQEPKPIRQVDAGLPKDLETICQKCLAKNPDERFPTALVLQEELERFRRGEPILSRRIGVWARTWRWAKRNRTVAALLAGIVATFAIAAIVSTLLSLRLVSAQRARARDLGVQLLTALPQNLRLLLDDIDSDYRELVRQPLLAAMPTSSELAESPSFSRPAARAPLGLIALGLPAKEEAAAGHQLLDQILRTSPAEVDELTALRDGLQQHGSPALLNQLSQRLWQQAEELQQEGTPRLQVFATLAAFDPHSPRWDDFARDVTDRLLATDPLLLPQWLDAIAPLRERLKQDLTDLFHRGTLPQQQSAARALARWFVDDPESRQEFVKYVLSAVPEQLGPLLSVLRHGDASRRTDWIARFTAAADAARSDPSELSEDQVISWANGAIALDTLDSPAILREGFQAVTDPSLRTELIPRVAASGMEVRDIWNEIQRGSPQPASTEVFHTAPADDLEVASWLLVFGNVDPGRQFAAERDLFLPQLDALARQHPDPGVHGAARWAIRQWGDTTFQNQASSAPIGRPGATPSRPSWRVNQAGTTLVALGPAPRFVIGSPLAEQRRFYPAGMSEIEEGEQQRPVALGYRFEVASFEVTSREFQSFERAWTEQINQALSQAKDAGDQERIDDLEGAIDFHQRQCDARADLVRDPEDPARGMSWYDALAYCRWLTEMEDRDEADRCYATLVDIAISASVMDPLEPRQDLVTSRAYRLPTTAEWEYAARSGSATPWFWGRFQRRSSEYCWIAQSYADDSLRPIGRKKPNRFGLFDTAGNITEWCQNKQAGRNAVRRALRGGSYLDPLKDLRSAKLFGLPSDGEFDYVGFRIARTVTMNTESLE